MFLRVHRRYRFAPAANLGMILLLGASTATADPPASEAKPAAQQPAASRTYIGTLEGAPKNSLIAVVVEGNEVLAYACSADEQFNTTSSRWFRGAAADGKLQAANDGVELEAGIGEGAVTGTLTGPDMKALKFQATPAGENGGLFRAEGKVDEEEHVAGWIADGRGTVVGSHHHKQFGGTGGKKFGSTGGQFGGQFGGTGGKQFGGTGGGSNFHFHHKQTFVFPSNHPFHNDFNFNKHLFFQQGSHNFHAVKVFHVPPQSKKR